MLMNSWLTLVTNSLQKSNLRRPAKSSRKHSRRVVGIRPAAETLETRALLSAISVSQSTMPMVVDLTAEGTTDWVSWAVPEDQQPVRPGFSTTPYAQKDGGADIGTVIYDSTVDPISDQQGDGDIDLRYLAFSAASAPYNVTWTDGDSSALWTGGPLDTGRLFQPNEILPDGLAHPSSSQGSGLLQAFADGAGGQGTAFTFPVTTSSTTPGELTLYLGNFAAEAELTVSLPGSAPFVVNHSTQHPGDRVSFTIEFQADNVGDVLTAEWRQTGITNSGFSNLQIIAATLDFQTPAAPTITSDGGGETASVNAAESQTAATDVQATDDNDAEGAGLVYSLSGGADHASFSIDANTGVLTFNTDPDFENPTDAGGDNVYDVQVTVTDAGSLADVQDIAVTVTDVNEAPSVALINTTNSLVENIDTGSSIKVADIVVTDDALGTNTLSLSGIDAVMFEITGTELFLKAGSTVDFETNPVLDVTVEVDDATVGGTPDDFAALAINVIDIDPVHVTCEVIDDVQALKDAGELGNGQVNPIINHLGQAKASLAKGKISHAIKKLEQGRDELQDLVDGGGLDAGLAIQLEAFVKSLNDVITEIQSGSA